MTDESTEGMRLAKFLARAGLGSRRASEKQIKAGKIQVNGQVCTNPATKVDPKKDKVFAGRRRMVIPKKVSDGGELFLAYKPEKMVTTMSDPQGRPTVKDLLPDRTARLFPVGRLDYDAEGALLFTSDGDLAHRLLHPSFHVPKIYLVKVKGEPSEASLEKLR
ncbi:MAG TPA: pseudouridine synthase, partial [Myxococcales bacterium]|nr:pseudouridine synthase [Myxococcales bacterium]